LYDDSLLTDSMLNFS